MVVGKIAVLTSGGDCQGMNTVINIIVRVAAERGVEVVGFKNGYQGLISDDFINLTYDDVKNISNIGGTILKTARCKKFQTKEGVKQAVETLKKHEVDVLIVIGGDGSFKGVLELKKNGVKTIAIPGTIDNDLFYTDRCLGFDTAVNNATTYIESVKQTMDSLDRCCIVEVMGRYCGDIALYCASASASDVLVLPELPTTEQEVIDKIKNCLKKGNKSPTVIVAEHMFDVTKLAEKVQKTLKIETKYSIVGYVQRGGSPSVGDRTLAVQFAVRAVDLALKCEFNRAVGVKSNKVIDVDIEDAINAESNFNFDLLRIFMNLNA